MTAEFNSILQSNLDQPEIRDVILSMANLSPSFSIADEMASIMQFQKLVSTASRKVAETLTSNSFVETPTTQQIETLNFPRNEEAFTFTSPTLITSVQEI